MDETQILNITMDQYKASRDSTNQKKIRMRERMKLYLNINKEDDKVSLYLIRSYVNTLLSLYYEDGLSQNFVSRDLYSFLEADNLNNVAQFDYDEMRMSSKDYITQKHRLLYGVSCRVWTGWNYDLELPDFQTIHPLSIYPDPLGHTRIQNFRYFGFERLTTMQEMEDAGYKNLDMVTSFLSDDESLNLIEISEPKEIYSTEHLASLREQWKKSKQTTIYYHYMMIDGVPHQIVVFAGKCLLSVKPIEPLKDDTSALYKLKFPIALNYYEPQEGDPWGVSLFDVLEDKQKNKTLITNLMRVKAMREALGGDTLIDSEVLKMNKSILSKPGVGRRYLPVSNPDRQPLQNAIHEVPQDKLSIDVYNFRDIMDAEAQSDANLGDNLRGLSAKSGTTATEVKTAQMNANVNLVLGNTINSWGEEDFWTGRYYWYKYYLRADSKKIIRLKRGIGTTGQLFQRKDLISGVDPDVTIENKSEIEYKRQAEGDKFLSYLPMWLQDPSLKPVSKRFLQRKSFRYLGSTSQEIEVIVPYTPEEMEAKQHLLLLNKNIPVEVGDLNEDHYTFIVIYAGALDTPAKRLSIEARKQAYITSGQMQQQQSLDQSSMNSGLYNSVANQSIANQMQQQQSTPSLQNIA